MSKGYEKHYSEDSLWDKISRYAKAAGGQVLEKVLLLYYAFPSAPKWAQGVIVGALGYFIMPLDAVPDFTPVVGYSDDLVALTAAVTAVGMVIDSKVKKKAASKLRDLGFA